MLQYNIMFISKLNSAAQSVVLGWQQNHNGQNSTNVTISDIKSSYLTSALDFLCVHLHSVSVLETAFTAWRRTTPTAMWWQRNNPRGQILLCHRQYSPKHKEIIFYAIRPCCKTGPPAARLAKKWHIKHLTWTSWVLSFMLAFTVAKISFVVAL